MLSLLSQILKYLRVSGKFWMGPVILMLLVVGGLLVLGQGSTLAPFIYALF